MRRLLVLICLLALLWTGWWALASWGIRMGIDTATGQTGPTDIQLGGVVQSGFPLRLHADLTRIDLQDRQRGTAIRLPAATLSTPAYWPGDITLTIPSDPVTYTVPGAQFMLRIQGAVARLRAHPGLALDLNRAEMTADGWQLNTTGGNLASGEMLVMSLVQSSENAAEYRATLNAAALSPGDLLRRILALDRLLPQSFDSAAAVLDVSFDGPLDRHSLNGPPPRPNSVTLHRLDIRWGEMAVTGDADLRFDAGGVPDGTVTLQIANWQTLARLIAQAGAADVVAQSQLILSAMANMDGDPETLTLPVRFADGQVFLGNFTLGPAPRLP